MTTLLLIAAIVLLLGSALNLAAWIYVIRQIPGIIVSIKHALRPPYGPGGPLG